MSKTHTVLAGETLKQISLMYYGVDSNYHKIISVNAILRERIYQARFTREGTPVIYAGDVLVIPEETKNIVNVTAGGFYKKVLPAASKDTITILIEGKQYQFFTDYTITSHMSAFDTVTLNSPYFDTPEYQEMFKPFAFREAAIYYGTELFMVAMLLAPEVQIDEDSKTLNLTFYPKCGMLNDCTLPPSMYPVAYDGFNLKEIAEAVTEPFGIGVEFQGDPGAAFVEVAPEPTESVLKFLVDLADERGFLVTNNKNGDLLIWQATKDSPTQSIRETKTPFITCTPKFSPQSYFSEITGLAREDEVTDAASYTWKNPFLQNVFRPQTIEVEETEDVSLDTAVKNYAGRMFGSVCTYGLVVNTHRTSDDTLIHANMAFSVLAKSASIYRETIFITEKVVLTCDTDKGVQAELTLVLPGAYSGTLPAEVPWEPEPKKTLGTFDTKTGLPTGGL